MSGTPQETLPQSTEPLPPEFGTPPADPIPLFRAWLSAAAESAVREPGALALATADAQGRASNRIVQLGRVTSDGFVFTTHTGSRKGRDLEVTAWGSAVLYWRELNRQIVLSGPVTRLPDAESDALWSARPVEAQVMTSASRQSEPLGDVGTLHAEVRRLTALGGPLPRPGTFAGYHLAPDQVEFWQGSGDRLHGRLHYRRVDGGWETSRLQP
ncbi:phenazine biosynthesis FMN-dependent oxidase PhzG [Streptomyces sp. NPDC050509]|uniref:phenazine biosynthesis FMN-dependent oxidase PhzG n=1 Tax=Streptomyces sp. NPDC050509 TaxID=3365620 RepID=UPI0037A29E3B